jgi:hypothetical protein
VYTQCNSCKIHWCQTEREARPEPDLSRKNMSSKKFSDNKKNLMQVCKVPWAVSSTETFHSVWP